MTFNRKEFGPDDDDKPIVFTDKTLESYSNAELEQELARRREIVEREKVRQLLLAAVKRLDSTVSTSTIIRELCEGLVGLGLA